MKLYEYALRRMFLLIFVLFAISLIVFYMARGVLPPEYSLAPYITPRMTDVQKLQLAQSLGVAAASCPSYQAFSSHDPQCVAPLWGQYVVWLGLVAQGNWGYSQLPGLAGDGQDLGRLHRAVPIYGSTCYRRLNRHFRHRFSHGHNFCDSKQ